MTFIPSSLVIVQPDFFLLDRDGTVLNRWTGPVPAEELEAAFMIALDG